MEKSSLPEAAGPLLWGTSQAGSTLLIASSAWMVSGLTSSPLLNGLLPAVAAIPILFNLRFKQRGYWLQVFGVAGLLIFSFFYSQDQTTKLILLIASFLSIFLHGMGQEISMVPIQKELISSSGTNMKKIQVGQEAGILAGNFLTAILFPAVRQFIPAFLLLIPMAAFIAGKRGASKFSQIEERKNEFNKLCLFQGLVLGGLFGMLALWVREIDGGKCFDFAMVLVAYSIGRALVFAIPQMPPQIRYSLIIVSLISIEILPIPWLSIVMFGIVGALVSASDFYLVDKVNGADDLPSRWQILQNSSVLGGLVGSVGLGALCQALGLDIALLIVIAGFTGLALATRETKKHLTAN